MIGKASPNTAYTLQLRLALRDIAPTVATSMLGTLDGKPEQKGVSCRMSQLGHSNGDIGGLTWISFDTMGNQ
jgi:hypothetical protein